MLFVTEGRLRRSRQRPPIPHSRSAGVGTSVSYAYRSVGSWGSRLSVQNFPPHLSTQPTKQTDKQQTKKINKNRLSTAPID